MSTPDARSTEGAVFNLSLGKVLESPLEFSAEIGDKFQWELKVQITNSKEHLANEVALAKAHGMNEKQILGYNPYAVANTARITVQYPDVGNDDAYNLQESSSQFFYRDFASFLSLIQRRRVLIFNLRLIPSSGTISMPPFAAAEHMDATAFGEPMFSEESLQEPITRYVAWYQKQDSATRDQIEGALARMSALLNLPYAYERAEGYWRILEALGADLPDTVDSVQIYDLAATKIGIKKKDSPSLRKVIRAATIAQPSADIDLEKICSAFHFRNEITHEFLREPLESQRRAPSVMPALQELCERFVLACLDAGTSGYRKPGYYIFFGRVM